jgi:hypothetical protein
MCKTEVRSGSEGAVRCLGQWCCSESHADAYAAVSTKPSTHSNVAIPPPWGLRAATRVPPWTLLSLAPLEWDEGSRAAVAPGSHHAARWWLVVRGRWRVAGAINGVTANRRHKHDA